MGRKKKYNDEELKEHNRERARRYYVLHRDEMMRRNREWRKANPDRIREYGKRQRKRRNVSQYNSEYYRKNRQRLIELASDWRKDYRIEDSSRELAHKRTQAHTRT